MAKIDQVNKNYEQIILTSKGIGKNYTERDIARINKYKENGTNENYKFKDGTKSQLPIYYRNKIYTEEEREKLWLEKLDKQERWILGQKIDISTKKGEKLYWEILKNAQKYNKLIGYGDDSKEWKKKDYNVTLNILKKLSKKKSKK